MSFGDGAPIQVGLGCSAVPGLYVEIEEQLTDLLGAPDSLVLPTITIIHTSMIPALAGQGTVLVDAQAHKTIYEGAAIARGAGASSFRVRANDYESPGGDPALVAHRWTSRCSASTASTA